MLQLTNDTTEIFRRLPESTQEYVTALLVCRSARVDKNRVLARNVVLAYSGCSIDEAERVCASVCWWHSPFPADTAYLREKWAPAFYDINTRYIPVRTSARHRFL